MSGKRKRKSKNPPQEEAGGGWIMTFADLMSLLMAFFVMLLAAAELDKKKFSELGKSMNLALGSPVSQNTDSVSDDFKLFDEQFKKEMIEHREEKKEIIKKIEETKKVAERLKEVLKNNIAQSQVEVISHGRIIIIRLLTSGIFESGKADIRSDFWPTIQKIKNELKEIKGDIVVSGYTDNVPIDNDDHRSNWELSAARAYSVIEYVVGGVNLPAERFVLRGFGETRSLVNNDTPESRAKNRRVEILIDQRDPADKGNDANPDSLTDLPGVDTPLPKDLESAYNATPKNPDKLPILKS